MPQPTPHRRYVLISLAVGAISVLLSFASYAFAHGSPVIGVLVFGFLTPAIAVLNLLGIHNASLTATYAVVFTVQFASSYLLCLLVGFIKRDVDRTPSHSNKA